MLQNAFLCWNLAQSICVLRFTSIALACTEVVKRSGCISHIEFVQEWQAVQFEWWENWCTPSALTFESVYGRNNERLVVSGLFFMAFINIEQRGHYSTVSAMFTNQQRFSSLACAQVHSSSSTTTSLFLNLRCSLSILLGMQQWQPCIALNLANSLSCTRHHLKSFVLQTSAGSTLALHSTISIHPNHFALVNN